MSIINESVISKQLIEKDILIGKLEDTLLCILQQKDNIECEKSDKKNIISKQYRTSSKEFGKLKNLSKGDNHESKDISALVAGLCSAVQTIKNHVNLSTYSKYENDVESLDKNEKYSKLQFKPNKFKHENDKSNEVPIEIDMQSLLQKELNDKEKIIENLEERLSRSTIKRMEDRSTFENKLKSLESALCVSENHHEHFLNKSNENIKKHVEKFNDIENNQIEKNIQTTLDNKIDCNLEALEFGKQILKELDEKTYNNIITVSNNGIEALPLIMRCLYSMICTLKANIIEPTELSDKSVDICNRIKRESSEEKSKLIFQFNQQIQKMKQKMQLDVLSALRQAEEATARVHSNIVENKIVQDNLNAQIKEKENLIAARDEKIINLEASTELKLTKLQDRISTLQSSVTTLEKENVQIRSERDHGNKQYSTISTLLNTKQEEVDLLEERLATTSNQLKQLEDEIEEKLGSLTQVQGIATDVVKTSFQIRSVLDQTCQGQKPNPNSRNTIQNEDHNITNKIKYLISEASKLLFEFTNLKIEKNLISNELEKRASLVKNIKVKMEKQKNNTKQLGKQQKIANNIIELKSVELDRTRIERDYFFHLLNEKSTELAFIRSSKYENLVSPLVNDKTGICAHHSSSPILYNNIQRDYDSQTDSLMISLESEKRDLYRKFGKKHLKKMQKRIHNKNLSPHKHSIVQAENALTCLTKRVDGLGRSRYHLEIASKNLKAATNEIDNRDVGDASDQRLKKLRKQLMTLENKSVEVEKNENSNSITPQVRKRALSHPLGNDGLPYKEQQHNCSAEKDFNLEERTDFQETYSDSSHSYNSSTQKYTSSYINHSKLIRQSSSKDVSTSDNGFILDSNRHPDVANSFTSLYRKTNYSNSKLVNGQVELTEKLRTSLNNLQKSAENLMLRARSKSMEVKPFPNVTKFVNSSFINTNHQLTAETNKQHSMKIWGSNQTSEQNETFNKFIGQSTLKLENHLNNVKRPKTHKTQQSYKNSASRNDKKMQCVALPSLPQKSIKENVATEKSFRHYGDSLISNIVSVHSYSPEVLTSQNMVITLAPVSKDVCTKT